jgi:hypothetical protein
MRFRPTAPIVVESLDVGVVMTLATLSPGGFSVQSSTAMAVGAVIRFRFSTPDGKWTTLLTAQSVYSRPDADAPPTITSFVSGFKFLNAETTRIAAGINALLERATAVISFS